MSNSSHPIKNMLPEDFEKSEEIKHFSQESKYESSHAENGRSPSSMNRLFNKDRYDSLSIPGYVRKKNQSQGPGHGQSMRQIMCHIARDIWRKAKLPKNSSCDTVQETWHTDADFQKSLSGEGWTEEKIRQCDAVALEDHSYEAI